jgi:integrase
MKFAAQHLGKKVISDIAKEIAGFHELNISEFGGHSFRRSGATSLANNGGSCQDLMMAGNWKSLAVARTYIEESDIATTKRAN